MSGGKASASAALINSNKLAESAKNAILSGLDGYGNSLNSGLNPSKWASVSVRNEGFSVASVSNHKRKPGVRGKIQFWSKSSSAAVKKILQSMKYDNLDDYCLMTATNTVRDIPDTPAEFDYAVKLYRQRIEYAYQSQYGIKPLFFRVTEFTRRKRPHIHMIYMIPKSEFHPTAKKALNEFRYFCDKAWVDVAYQWGSTERGQHYSAIYDTVGFSKYMAKHLERSPLHYQRSAKSIPAAWAEKTGKVWSCSRYIKDFLLDKEVKFRLPASMFPFIRRRLSKYMYSIATSDSERMFLKNQRSPSVKPVYKDISCLDVSTGEVTFQIDYVATGDKKRRLSNCIGMSSWLSKEKFYSVMRDFKLNEKMYGLKELNYVV